MANNYQWLSVLPPEKNQGPSNEWLAAVRLRRRRRVRNVAVVVTISLTINSVATLLRLMF